MQSDRHARIKDRAYLIWLAEGEIHGKDEEHWHRAAREIAEEEPTASGQAGAQTLQAKAAKSGNGAAAKAPKAAAAAKVAAEPKAKTKAAADPQEKKAKPAARKKAAAT